jgi:citrate lyase subunit beta / citryl-CoA lyase
MTGLGVARSWLFVPGDRNDRFDKAYASGADVVILDLEDAVAPAAKEQAREHVARYLASSGRPGVVRVKPVGTGWHVADVAMVAGCGAAVMLPKAARAEDVASLGVDVVALVETAAGVLGSAALASVPGVVRLAFGNLDLAAELGVDPHDRHALYAARAQLVLASAAAGLPAPVDAVTEAVHDRDVLTADLEYARRLGFGAKLCIHPAQVAPVNTGFAPSPAEVAWAQDVIDTVRAGGHGVIVHNGQMIDAPVRLRAERILRMTSFDREH